MGMTSSQNRNRARPAPRESPSLRPAVAYLRASTKKQHLSCDDQLQTIEGYCQREGLGLVRVFRDDGVSGTKGRGARAGWDELLDFVESGQLVGGVVVVWSLDRWARDFRAGLLAAWAVGDQQVEIHTTDAGRVDLESAEGQVMGALKLALAARESRERSRRVRERKALHRAAGYWVTKPPLGFITVGDKGRRELGPDPAWAPVVLELFERFDRGATYDALARWLNDEQLTTRSGKPFTRTTVNRILAGWAYGGFQASRTTGEILPAKITTFIPRELWERCRRRAEPHGGTLRPPRVYPLSGIVRCGSCGSMCHVFSGGGTYRGKEYPRRYRCPLVRAGACQNTASVGVAELEQRVLEWWRGLVDQGAIEDLARRAVEAEHAEAMAAAAARRPLDEQLAELELQELRLVDAIKEAGLSPVIQRELEKVRGRARAVRSEAEAIGPVVMPLDLCAAVCELQSLLSGIESATALRDHIDRISVKHDRVKIVAFGETIQLERDWPLEIVKNPGD